MRRLAGTRPDLQDCRMVRQEPKQVRVHGRWVAGPYFVVNPCGTVEGCAWLRRRSFHHGAIIHASALAGLVTAGCPGGAALRGGEASVASRVRGSRALPR